MIFLRSESETGSWADSLSRGKKNSSSESLILSLKDRKMGVRNGLYGGMKVGGFDYYDDALTYLIFCWELSNFWAN